MKTKIKKDKNGKIIIERKNYHCDIDYWKALRLEKALDEMEIRVDIEKRTCFECKELVKKETDLEFYQNLDKWVKICPKCKKKFSKFGVEQINAGKSPLNWYKAKSLKLEIPPLDETQITILKQNIRFWEEGISILGYWKNEDSFIFRNDFMRKGNVIFCISKQFLLNVISNHKSNE